MFKQEWLALLRCPETHQHLSLAPQEILDAVNRRIAEGRAVNRAGQPVCAPFVEGLLREDRQCLYPLRNHLPILLISEALMLDGDARGSTEF